MKNRIYFTLVSGLLLMFPVSVWAHIGDSGGGLVGVLMHPFTGIDHILMMVLVAAVIVYYIRKHHRRNE